MTAQKYIRTTLGFTVFPVYDGIHSQVATTLLGQVLSAGLVDWDVDGRPLCMGQSETLGIASRADDTAALRKAWGMVETAEQENAQ